MVGGARGCTRTCCFPTRRFSCLVRRDHHIVSVAVILGSSPRTAVGVNTDGRREVLGMTVGHSEAEPFWVEFLRSLARRGLRGVKLVISDAHEGLKARSEEHTSELQSLMRISYAVFCLKKK